ncbi:hypothetical protein [Alkalicoccus chagannorensis]|uniref:rolling circle replication-associated protein n=2 Tax=Bacillati TaxID=1783272 RepID=UPI000A06EF1D
MSQSHVDIKDDAIVKVKHMNHVIDVSHSSRRNSKVHTQKINSDEYVDISTGEIKEYAHTDNRGQNYNSLRKTFNRLRDLINNNFVGDPNELHITLTYKENQTDTTRLYNDFQRMIDKLRYKYKGITTIDYLNVIEPQKRGAWHCHLLLRFNDVSNIYVSNSDVASMWGKGYVRVQALKNIDNIGAYLSAYLTDVELTEETYVDCVGDHTEIIDKQVSGEDKKYIKGGRLAMYPPGLNIYRKSKGISPPVVEEMTYKKAKEKAGAGTPTYQKSITLNDDDFSVTHQYVQFNTRR